MTRVITVMVLTIGALLTAVPAYAAQGSEDGPVVGSAEGLLVALIVGGLVGLIVFVDVFTGEGPEDMPELPREH
ncbi:MAG: hypothetical protein R3343_03570 [Nitriliruptorales bacterium]|nr:hypothetical protein [Nitriliruptorales bacterium]